MKITVRPKPCRDYLDAEQFKEFGDDPDVLKLVSNAGFGETYVVWNGGTLLTVNKGDWILRDDEGDCEVYTDEYFKKNFEEVKNK